MEHMLDLRSICPKEIFSLGENFAGTKPDGQSIDFTNYFMRLNDKPFFGVSGEFHFSRYRAEEWAGELCKMRMGGVNIVSTYVLWNHHEEKQGCFDFSGCRNLRRFLELCSEQGLYVILRIGPFCHGEVRNGGLPDWLYGQPFVVRSTQPGFMSCVERLYEQIHQQVAGHYFSEGGPVIGAQIDNEYMHSGAPWEMTTGVSDEWIPAGSEGNEYMLALLELAKRCGIRVPFYTCTGWGGAATPQQLLPLWGGYSFRPWIFYERSGEHPATEEYLYRDNHNNTVPSTYNFEPCYRPEDKPYLCCEMGGGMMCSYYYRFQLPYESVDAMANIKLGSGCNMLGYYMYHGGTNPLGGSPRYLNEGQVPKRGYDYQAALGEFGQVRPSYHRLRMLHYFTQSFSPVLCRAKTVLPHGSQEIQPEDTQSLRWAVRVTPEGGGFLFINNYQDHAPLHAKKQESIRLKTAKGDILFQNISLAAGENCILPFMLRLGNVPLHHATVQPICVTEYDGETYAYSMVPQGMDTPHYQFEPGVQLLQADDTLQYEMRDGLCVQVPKMDSHFEVQFGGKNLHVVTISRQRSMEFYTLQAGNGHMGLFTQAVPLANADTLCVEHSEPGVQLRIYPPQAARELGMESDRLVLEKQPLQLAVDWKEADAGRYILRLPACPVGLRELMLQIEYEGDIGQLFLDGELVADNFCNGAPWEVGLRQFGSQLAEKRLVLYISPLKRESRVNVESVMAGRREEVMDCLARLTAVRLKPVYSWCLDMNHGN